MDNIKPINFKQHGMSLIEMLVAMAVAVVVMSFVTTVFVNIYTSADKISQSMRHKQDMNAVLRFISSELKRAGTGEGGTAATTHPRLFVKQYSGGAWARSTNTSGAIATCVIFYYDANTDGNHNAGEIKGYRFSTQSSPFQENQLQVLRPNRITATCGNDANWEPMLHASDDSVTNFSVSVDPPTLDLAKRRLTLNLTATHAGVSSTWQRIIALRNKTELSE